MRASNFHIATAKETPADAEIVSHQLMLRAGMIRRLGSGLYTWMPFGLRVARKVERIVREEMDRSGAVEVLMPAVQPAELWQESGRWEKYGPELLRLSDRHDRAYCVGPTHEEVITDIARRDLKSYRQLPINFYQIQTKFRDEIRPRFGVMRSREFVMKDAYSFHSSAESLGEMFDHMHDTYCRIFDRIGLEYRPVEADSGSIGGAKSREFHVIADSGEDALVYSTESNYAANMEKAEAINSGERQGATAQMQRVETPNVHTMQEVADLLQMKLSDGVKTLVVKSSEGGMVALVLRGDHELNTIKAEHLDIVAAPLEFADEAEIRKGIGCGPGSIGPLGLDIPVVVDHAAAVMSDYVSGANEDGVHITGVNWGRDLPEPVVADIRNVVAGDPSPDGQGSLKIQRGIEVGHIFQLGTTYSEPMQATLLDENGKNVVMHMGCYGIGITRIVAAAIEQNHDTKGIVWPLAIAPFEVVISPIHMHKSETVRDAATALYKEFQEAGIDVLFDDRQARPGVMFADMELIGIPHRVVISDKGLEKGELEYKGRADEEATLVPRGDILSFLQAKYPAAG